MASGVFTLDDVPTGAMVGLIDKDDPSVVKVVGYMMRPRDGRSVWVSPTPEAAGVLYSLNNYALVVFPVIL